MRRRAANSQSRQLFGFVVAVLLITACNRAPQGSTPPSSSNEWHDFQGTWIATGTRKSIPLGSDRRASIAQLSGSLVLSGPSRPDVGFLADAIVLNDTVAGTTGRAVWTDEHGDQIYSELKGEATATGSRISGTFIGGSGRYTGAIGSYQFAWRFVIDTEDGHMQGQSEGLTGQISLGSSSPATGTGSTR
jgi:hypothetical protein